MGNINSFYLNEFNKLKEDNIKNLVKYKDGVYIRTEEEDVNGIILDGFSDNSMNTVKLKVDGLNYVFIYLEDDINEVILELNNRNNQLKVYIYNKETKDVRKNLLLSQMIDNCLIKIGKMNKGIGKDIKLELIE